MRLQRPFRSTFWRRLLRRDRPEPGPVQLDRRRIYVLPTRNGMIFALLLLAMLVGSINYDKSLGFVLVFLLTSLALLSAVHGFFNLHRLRLRSGKAQPVFAGDPARFPVSVENPGHRERLALRLYADSNHVHPLELDPQQGHWVNISQPSRRRGRLQQARITIESYYPLGLFRIWAYVFLDNQCLVYPEPAKQSGLPQIQLAEAGGEGDRGRGSDDFAALRNYHPGDSLRHVHWKTAARGQGLYTKQFGGQQVQRLWLDWALLPGLDTEARLSRLCRWVLDADAEGLVYGLRLPDLELSPQSGDRQRQRCLEALALFGEQP